MSAMPGTASAANTGSPPPSGARPPRMSSWIRARVRVAGSSARGRIRARSASAS